MIELYPYVQSPDKFKEFLVKIKGIGVPTEIGEKWLKSLGYKSSNDKRFLHAIKFIGLVENKRGGGPTKLWQEMRTSSKVALAKGIQQGYSELFGQYPDAYRRDDEALNSFFAAHTTAGETALRRMVATFKSLCTLADFSSEPEETTKDETTHSRKPPSTPPPVHSTIHPAGSATVNINIQLQVPPDATGEIYEKFFAAMRKNLWSDAK